MRSIDGVRVSWHTALALVLIVGCGAGGAGGGGKAEGAAPDDGAAAPAPPSAPTPATPNPPPLGGGSATPPGGTPQPGSGEENPVPGGIDPGGQVPGASVDDEDEDEDDPVTPDPPVPPADGDSFIRGDAPTLESATRPGPFDVDVVESGLRDGPGYGTQTLHVPEGAEPPFAGVVVVPGFVSPESAIRAWGPFLASHGIVTLTIGTNSGGDSPDVRARALLDGIETLKAENTRADGPLEGQMALDRFAVMGWSMGGGGTLIAANQTPELRAAISLAAWSPGVRFAQNEVPTLLLAGSADPLAGGQSQGFFDSIPETTPKMLFEVAGGPHDIANNPTAADGEIGRYGLSWMKVFLEGDERYRQFLLETPSNQSDFKDNL